MKPFGFISASKPESATRSLLRFRNMAQISLSVQEAVQ